MIDRFHAMQVFVTVVEAGSFSAAAKRLQVGQPTVSKIVAALEKRLGVSLLHRTTRSQSLTIAGERFHERAVIALGEAERAEADAQAEATLLQGMVRVSAAPLYAANVIIPSLPSLFDAHPGVEIDLVLADRHVDLVRAGIDVAIRSGELSDSGMTARRIGRTPRLAVASPALIEAQGVPASPEELDDYEAVAYGILGSDTSWTFHRDGKTAVATPRRRLRVDSAEALRAALVTGLGVGIVSRTMVAAELESGALVPLLSEWSLPSSDVHAVFPAGRRTSRRARVFVDHLIASQSGAVADAEDGGANSGGLAAMSIVTPPSSTT